MSEHPEEFVTVSSKDEEPDLNESMFKSISDTSDDDISSVTTDDGLYDVKLSCGMCESNTFEAELKYCSTCGIALCKKCAESHRRLPALRSHSLSDTPASGDSVVLYDPCSDHSLSLLQYYCTQCHVPVCCECRLEKHKDHETVDIQKQAEENKERFSDRLEEEMTRRSELVNELKKRIEDIKALHEQATRTTLSDRNSMIQTINQAFDSQQAWNDELKAKHMKKLYGCLGIANSNIKTISAMKNSTPASLTDLALLTSSRPIQPELLPVFRQGTAVAMMNLIKPTDLKKDEFINCVHNRFKQILAKWVLSETLIVRGGNYHKIKSSTITTLSVRWVTNLIAASLDRTVSLEPVKHTDALRAMEPDTYCIVSTEDARHLRTLFGSANEHDIPEIQRNDFKPDMDIYILRIKDLNGTVTTKLLHGNVLLPAIENQSFSSYSGKTVAQVFSTTNTTNFRLIEY